MTASRPRPWLDPTALVGFDPDWAGQFDTFDEWVRHASRALPGVVGSIGQELPAFCVDAKGRRCHVGADFIRARDEDTFPVRYFWEFRRATARDLTITNTTLEGDMSLTDAYGIAWAHRDCINVGDRVRFDGDFTCVPEGETRTVKSDPEREGFEALYIACECGQHYLEGQLDFADTGALVGLYPVS